MCSATNITLLFLRNQRLYYLFQIIKYNLEFLCTKIMRFADPFQFLPKKNRKSIFFISGLVTLILLITLLKINQPLINTNAPFGIITFELSEDLNSSVSILESWGSNNKIYAALSLGLDFVFIIFYALFLSLVCFKLSEGLYGNYATIKLANLGPFSLFIKTL